MTNYLFEKAKEGDNILIKGPLGKFTLPGVPYQDLNTYRSYLMLLLHTKYQFFHF